MCFAVSNSWTWYYHMFYLNYKTTHYKHSHSITLSIYHSGPLVHCSLQKKYISLNG